MRLIIVVIALILTFNTVVYAQECESVIALSKVVTSAVSDKESVEQHAANFCNEYSRSHGSSSSASYGASYKFLSASFGSSSVSAETVASKYCSASNSYSATKDAYKQYIETISPNAYSAYEQCLKMSKQDLLFNVNVGSILPNQFSMSTSYVSSIAGSTQAVVTYSASNGVSCKWDGSPDKKQTILTGSTVILECTRTDPTKKSFVTLVRNDGRNEPLTLPWQAYDKDGIPIDSLSALQTKVDSVLSQLGPIKTEIEKLSKKANILAILTVQGGRVVTSSEGVSFESSTGVITFSNNDRIPFVPLISDYSKGANYITETHYVREILGTNKFKIWRTPLDTSARNSAPQDFVAIVVGY